jgi:hypothetical protein
MHLFYSAFILLACASCNTQNISEGSWNMRCGVYQNEDIRLFVKLHFLRFTGDKVRFYSPIQKKMLTSTWKIEHDAQGNKVFHIAEGFFEDVSKITFINQYEILINFKNGYLVCTHAKAHVDNPKSCEESSPFKSTYFNTKALRFSTATPKAN